MPVRPAKLAPTGRTTRLATWGTLGKADSGEPVKLDFGEEAKLTVWGAFGGGTISLEGSDDGFNWSVVSGPQNTRIAKKDAGVMLVPEAPRYIRPIVIGGHDITAIVAQVVLRRIQEA